MAGLRERKKSETRERISAIATRLFLARGFDNVTVAEVAEAADVSKMTVFNYFPRKEELFFDRGDEAIALLEGAVLGRAAGEPVLASLRALWLELTGQRHPLSALRDGVNPFWQVVLDSPALRTAAREWVERLEQRLAELLATATAAPPDDPMPALVAGLVLATYRTLHLNAARRLLAGEHADDIHPGQVALTNRAFDLLDAGLPGYGVNGHSGVDLSI